MNLLVSKRLQKPCSLIRVLRYVLCSQKQTTIQRSLTLALMPAVSLKWKHCTPLRSEKELHTHPPTAKPTPPLCSVLALTLVSSLILLLPRVVSLLLWSIFSWLGWFEKLLAQRKRAVNQCHQNSRGPLAAGNSSCALAKGAPTWRL